MVSACFSGVTTPDFDINLQRLQQMMPNFPNLQCTTFEEYRDNPTRATFVVAVDALFGIGLSRPLSGEYAEVVDFINAQQHYVVAVDVPSGLFMTATRPKRLIESRHTAPTPSNGKSGPSYSLKMTNTSAPLTFSTLACAAWTTVSAVAANTWQQRIWSDC